jgi:hypothetical protein
MYTGWKESAIQTGWLVGWLVACLLACFDGSEGMMTKKYKYCISSLSRETETRFVTMLKLWLVVRV